MGFETKLPAPTSHQHTSTHLAPNASSITTNTTPSPASASANTEKAQEAIELPPAWQALTRVETIIFNALERPNVPLPCLDTRVCSEASDLLQGLLGQNGFRQSLHTVSAKGADTAQAFLQFKDKLETMANAGENFVVRLSLKPDHHAVLTVKQPEVYDEEYPESPTLTLYQAQVGRFSIRERGTTDMEMGLFTYNQFMSNFENILIIESQDPSSDDFDFEKLNKLNMACFGAPHESVEPGDLAKHAFKAEFFGYTQESASNFVDSAAKV